jgi:hypothetical protein
MPVAPNHEVAPFLASVLVLNDLIDQIIEIDAQSIEIVQTKQKRDVDFYYMKRDHLKRNI